MDKNCENCRAARADFVPFVVYESGMARMERSAKRLWIIILILIFLLVGSNVAWMVYESQFEAVTSESYEADSGDGGTAVINGSGEVNVNGPSESN